MPAAPSEPPSPSPSPPSPAIHPSQPTTLSGSVHGDRLRHARYDAAPPYSWRTPNSHLSHPLLMRTQSNPYPPPPAQQQQPPPPVPHKVWILDCRTCGTFLTNRGMKASCRVSFSFSFSVPGLRASCTHRPFCTGRPPPPPVRAALLVRRAAHQLFSLHGQPGCPPPAIVLPPAVPSSHMRVPHPDSLLPWLRCVHRLHDCHTREYLPTAIYPRLSSSRNMLTDARHLSRPSVLAARRRRARRIARRTAIDSSSTRARSSPLSDTTSPASLV
jgi:hypothetical protein